MEGLDKYYDIDWEIWPFYDVAPDAEELSAEDDPCYEWHEDQNEDSDADEEESECTNDESNMILPSMIITIEDVKKNERKEFEGTS